MVLLRNLFHLGLNGLAAAHGLGTDGTNITPRNPMGEAALLSARSVPGMVTDVVQFRQVLKRARRVVEGQTGMVQVPAKELHQVLDKIKALEDQVNGMLASEGDNSATPTATPEIEDCSAERLLLHIGPRSLSDGSIQVSDHPFFRRTNCDMASLAASQAVNHNAAIKQPLLKPAGSSGSADMAGDESTPTTAMDASATVSDAVASMAPSLASAIQRYKAALNNGAASPTPAPASTAAASSEESETVVLSTTTIRRTKTVTFTHTKTLPLAKAMASTDSGKKMVEGGDNSGGAKPADKSEISEDKSTEPAQFGNTKAAGTAQKFSNSSGGVASNNAIANSPPAEDSSMSMSEVSSQLPTSSAGSPLEGAPKVTPFMPKKPEEPKTTDPSSKVSQPKMTEQPQKSSLPKVAGKPPKANQYFKAGFANSTTIATPRSGFVTIATPMSTKSTKTM